MKRNLLQAAVLTGAYLAAERTADACSQPGGPTEPELESVKLIASQHLPRNIGIPLAVRAYGNVDSTFVQTNLQIQVSAGGTPVAGTLEVTADPGLGVAARWKPASDLLPAGSLTVRWTIAGQPPIVEAISVDDRIAVAVSAPVTIEVTRDEVADESAPKIVCTRKRGIGECSGGSVVTNVSTRWFGIPSVAVTVAPTSSVDDVPFSSVGTEIFGRDKSGARGAVRAGGFAYSQAGTEHRQLERPFDEYCVTTTTRILGLAEAAVATTCRAQAVDLSVPDDVVVEHIRQQTSSCDSAEYPDGTSSDDPTGEGGCSMAPAHTRTPIGAWALALLALVFVRRRHAR